MSTKIFVERSDWPAGPEENFGLSLASETKAAAEFQKIVDHMVSPWISLTEWFHRAKPMPGAASGGSSQRSRQSWKPLLCHCRVCRSQTCPRRD